MNDSVLVISAPKEILTAPAGPRAVHYRVTGRDFRGEPVVEDVFYDPDNPLHVMLGAALGREKDYGI